MEIIRNSDVLSEICPEGGELNKYIYISYSAGISEICLEGGELYIWYIYLFSRNSAGVSEISPEGGELYIWYIFISSLGIVLEYLRLLLLLNKTSGICPEGGELNKYIYIFLL